MGGHSPPCRSSSVPARPPRGINPQSASGESAGEPRWLLRSLKDAARAAVLTVNLRNANCWGTFQSISQSSKRSPRRLHAVVDISLVRRARALRSELKIKELTDLTDGELICPDKLAARLRTTEREIEDHFPSMAFFRFTSAGFLESQIPNSAFLKSSPSTVLCSLPFL